MFDELTLVERFLIARAYLIGYIIRFSKGSKTGISYRGARGYIIAFKQDLSKLFTILLSSELNIYKFITVS